MEVSAGLHRSSPVSFSKSTGGEQITSLPTTVDKDPSAILTL